LPDPFNPETWKQEWTPFASAPYITGTIVATACVVVWWFRGTTFKAQIAGLKEQIGGLKEQTGALNEKNSVTEQRLKLATEQATIAGQIQSTFEKQLWTLEMAIVSKADSVELAELSAEVSAEFAKLMAANNAVRSTVSAELRATEAPDIARFTIQN
jgi:hypothetical protein